MCHTVALCIVADFFFQTGFLSFARQCSGDFLSSKVNFDN